MEPLDQFDDALPMIVDQIFQLAAGLLVVLFFVWLIVYAITVIPRHKLFKMAGYPAWQAWVPFVNVFVQAKITGRSPWLFLGLYLGLPVLTYIPFVGGLFWLLPTLLTAWMCYDLALVYGQSKRFALWFSIITASTVNYSLGFGLWEAFKSMMASVDYGIATASALTSFFSSGPGFWVQLLQLVALILVYVLAFGSGTHYEGPYAHRNERMLMHEPWLFVPGPNQSIPVPPQPMARAYQPSHAGYDHAQGYQPAPQRPIAPNELGSFAQPSGPAPSGFSGGQAQPTQGQPVQGQPQGQPVPNPVPQPPNFVLPADPPVAEPSGEPAGQPEATLPDFPSSPPVAPPTEPPPSSSTAEGESEEPTLVEGAGGSPESEPDATPDQANDADAS